MSKCRPDKKKIRRRLQNEHKKEVAELQELILYKNHEVARVQGRTEELEKRVEEYRLALRELGNDHSLKYEKQKDDGTLMLFTRVKAEELNVKVAGRTKDAVEEKLVHEIALGLMRKNLVRIEEVEPRSYEDMQRGTVTFTARIDVIPWWKCVKPEIVFLDRDTSRMIMREGERQ